MPGSRHARRPVPRAFRLASTLAAGFALGSGALAGCASEQSMPKIDFPAPATGAQVVNQQPVPTAASPSYTGYAPPYNAIAVRIGGIPGGTVLSYPMPWLTFTVTLTNTSGFAFHSLDPLLVFGQCTCSPHHDGIAPSTNLQLWDAGSGTWKSIRSSETDRKGGYKYAPQLGSVDLGPKAAATYRYRVQLSRNTGQRTGLVDGTGSLNVYVLQLPKHTRLSAGLAPEATVALAYRFG